MLQFIFNRFLKDCPYIVLVPTTKVSRLSQLNELYSSYIEDGYEGQIVRRDGLYENKRSKQLLKRKEFITEEFTLVDIQEGIGNWAGAAKRIFFRYKTGDVVKAGLRGTKEFARRLLEEKDKYIGSPVTIRYFTPTPADVPRFGVAIDFHPGGRMD
jgi:DNA ligase-1